MVTKSILAISLIAVLLIGAVSFDDSFAAKDGVSNGQPFQEIQSQVDAIEVEIEELKLVSHEPVAIFGDPDFAIFGDPDVAEIFGDPDFDALFGDPDFMIQSLQDADDDLQSQIDSFFDVFFGTESHTGDSFFDIFTNVEPDGTTTTPDSFFDVFVEIDERDQHFDTEILSMDLRGQSCNVGDVVTGVDASGNLICATDSTDTGAKDCPSDMIKSGLWCIDNELHPATNNVNSIIEFCSQNGKVLPPAEAFEHAFVLRDLPDGQSWSSSLTSSYTPGNQHLLVLGIDGEAIPINPGVWNDYPFRCGFIP